MRMEIQLNRGFTAISNLLKIQMLVWDIENDLCHLSKYLFRMNLTKGFSIR